MEFSFPPAPPGYSSVLTARWLLVAWSIVGLAILIVRLRRWKFICPREILFWIGAAVISGLVAPLGICHFQSWDDNAWLIPSVTAALAVSVAGVATGLSKLYVEGYARVIQRCCEVTFALVLIGGVGAMLIPPSTSFRNASNRSECKNNLKQIGLAMHNYHDTFGVFPPAVLGETPVSWRVMILPYVHQAPLYNSYDRRTAWDRLPNDKLASEELRAYGCPSNHYPHDSQGRWFTAYSMPTGPHSVGASPKGTRIRDITDGTSDTLLVVEACGAQIVWTEPRDVDVASQPPGINLNGSKPGQSAGWMSSYHTGWTQSLMADGSVRYFSAKTDPALLKKLATVDGGEEVGDY